jgi:hypothetical protein
MNKKVKWRLRKKQIGRREREEKEKKMIQKEGVVRGKEIKSF